MNRVGQPGYYPNKGNSCCVQNILAFQNEINTFFKVGRNFRDKRRKDRQCEIMVHPIMENISSGKRFFCQSW